MSVQPPASPQTRSFISSVAAIATGAAASQALALLALPFVTRLYLPQHFGVLAVYAGIVGILAVIACLRFDNAIPLPRSGRAAVQVAVAAFVSLLGVSALTVLGGAVFSNLLPENIERISRPVFVALLAIGVLGSGFYQIGMSWSVRLKNFSLIGKTRFQQTIVSTAAQLGMGVAGFGAIGLIAGQILSQATGFVALMRGLAKQLLGCTSVISSRRRIVWSIKRYRRFPMYDAPAALLNSASAQIPAILFAAWFSPALAGYYALSMKLLSAPIGLIGTSISQVLTPKLVESRRSGNAQVVMKGTFRLLVRLSGIPFALFIALAPSVFPVVFGLAWTMSGEVAAWTAAWVCIQFVYTPLSVYLICAEAQRLNMCIQAVFFALRFTPILMIPKGLPGVTPVIVFSVMSIVCYLGALFVLTRFSGMGVGFVLKELVVEAGVSGISGGAAWFLVDSGYWKLLLALTASTAIFIYRLKKAKLEFSRALG